jgi:AcrR family transcriptional regulator
MAATEPEALRPPLQNRSRETLERVMHAGEKLQIETRWYGFTDQEVSRRSKVSIGSIYARAPSKEALLLAIYDRAVDRIAVENQAGLAPDEHWDGMEPRQLIMEATRELAVQMLRHQTMLRVFMNRSPVDPVINERGDAAVRKAASRYEELLLRHQDHFTHPDPALAIEIAFRMVFMPMRARVSLGADFGAYRMVDDDELIEELGRGAAAYLLDAPRTTRSS